MKAWLFVYSASGLPTGGRLEVVDTGACRTALLGFPSAAAAMTGLGAGHASELARCELVELCGAFGAAHVAEVERLTEKRVPIGLVTYTGDMTARLHALFG